MPETPSPTERGSTDSPSEPAADTGPPLGDRDALLPEERAAGSDDPAGQAAAILEESDSRTLAPEPVERRTSDDTTEPPG